MLKDVEILISKSVGEVLKSPDLTLKLLRVYSKLYLHGAAPGYCERSIRMYHEKLKSDGMFKVNENLKVAQRTCLPKWKGNRYYTAIHTHVSAENLTDEEAVKLLEAGILKSSDFEKLPEGYGAKKKATEPEPKIEAEPVKEIVKEPVKAAKPKKGKK